jgi:hypothetical protein
MVALRSKNKGFNAKIAKDSATAVKRNNARADLPDPVVGRFE